MRQNSHFTGSRRVKNYKQGRIKIFYPFLSIQENIFIKDSTLRFPVEYMKKMEQELCTICQNLDSIKDYDIEKWKSYVENEEESGELLKHSLLQNLHKSGHEELTEPLIWLLNSKDALEQLTCSGPVENARCNVVS